MLSRHPLASRLLERVLRRHRRRVGPAGSVGVLDQCYSRDWEKVIHNVDVSRGLARRWCKLASTHHKLIRNTTPNPAKDLGAVMASLLKRARGLVRRQPWTPLRFPTTGFNVVPPEHALEEECPNEFKTGSYYAVAIGDLFASGKYQVVGKLGFGSTPTVWLARDPSVCLFPSSLLGT